MSVGFIFPGQGSQKVGMLMDLRSDHALLNERLREASDEISIDLISLINIGPAERLNQTEITQPLLLAVSVALYELWIQLGGERPVAMAGHSLGEYSALTAAGMLDFGDAIRLVHERGHLMQEAVPANEGAMVAVMGLSDEEMIDICKAIEGMVSPANMNAPGQVVLAGSRTAVIKAGEAAQVAGARRVVPLDVSIPSHCVLMEPARGSFSELLRKVHFHESDITVYHNVDVQPASTSEEIRAKLTAQLSSPVLWSSLILEMIASGVTRFVECGPGNVLSGLMKRINRSVSVLTIGSVDGLRKGLEV